MPHDIVLRMEAAAEETQEADNEELLNEGAREIARLREALSSETAAREKAERERDEARGALERDRVSAVNAVNQFNDAFQRRRWLLESRGPYEWDDDRYRDEFSAAYDELKEPIEVLRKIGRDWSNCPVDHEAIAKARRDLDTTIADLTRKLEVAAGRFERLSNIKHAGLARQLAREARAAILGEEKS